MGTIVNASSVQSTFLGVLVGPAALIPADFVLRRGYEGPQIIIEWGDPFDPGSVVSVTLVRRRFGFPTTPTDGVVLFTGAPGPIELSDQAVEDCVVYFYRIFVVAVNGDIVFSLEAQGSIIPIKTGFFGTKLWEIIPEFYKLSDKGLGEALSVKRSLTEAAAAGEVEVFNLGEDGTDLYGPLRRLFRLFGPILDEAKGLIDCFPPQLDVDDSDIPQLEGIANLLGLDLNKELAPEAMRNEVRLQAENLKLKGTIPGLQSSLRAITGLDAVIDEQCNNILISNDPDKTSPGFTPGEKAAIGGPGELIYYSPGFALNIPPFWLWFSAFLDFDLAVQGLTEVLGRKMCLVLDRNSPACHRGFLFIRITDGDTQPISFTEDFDDAMSSLDEEDMLDMIEVSFDSQVANSAKWLLFSDSTKTFNTADYTAVFAVPDLP